MNGEAIACLQIIAYALIETEAMKVTNLERERDGKALAYDESAFYRVAEDMRGSVNKLLSYV